MINFDDQQIYEKFDTTNLHERIEKLPQQCRQAWQNALTLPLPEDFNSIDKIVILGMGGSAIGGDLLRTMVSLQSKIDVTVQRDYDLPKSVNANTLVIASSYSGNTEETLSAFSQALEIPCKKFVITTGGKISEMAARNGVPLLSFGYSSEPRAALGCSLFSMLAFMQKLNIIPEELMKIDESLESLSNLSAQLSKDIPMESNPAKQLAAKLYGNIVIVYGAGILSSVAYRWKTQINENSKAWAFSETLPELNHNAVVGYRFPADMADRIFVVMLRSGDMHARTLKRYDITSDILSQAHVPHEVVDTSGDTPLCRMMNSILLGDYVSYYLAILYEINPSPVEIIDYLKKSLSS
ncbi:MAG: bifunctional phosphoglucose/phosphomannose isomerase [Dehalococcoidia bacterium]|jgi:glucose/mannose-6-phosphate isomerase